LVWTRIKSVLNWRYGSSPSDLYRTKSIIAIVLFQNEKVGTDATLLVVVDAIAS